MQRCFVGNRQFTALFVCFALLVGSVLPLGGQVQAATSRPVDWFRDARWGVMMHYLADEASDTSAPTISVADWNTRVNNFDVNGLADQLQTVGAKYFLITLGQNSGFFISPNRHLRSVSWAQPKPLSTATCRSSCTTRSTHAASSGGSTCRVAGHGNDALFQQNVSQDEWRESVRQWSLRWGTRVAGWWLDGGCGNSALYTAVRAGNPDAIAGVNCGGVGGILDDPPNQDYTGGEVRYPERNDFSGPQTRWVGDSQAHILTFLGGDWGRPDTRYDDATVLNVTRKLTDYQGVVTWDVPYIKSNGLLAPDAFAAMYMLNKNLNGGATNLALNRPAVGSGLPCSGDESAANATDSNKATQWCATWTGSAATLDIDLGTNQTVEAVIVRHAEEAGNPWYNNTRNFLVQSSPNGVDSWSTIATMVDNGGNNIEGSRYTGFRVDVSVRYLRLSITGGDFWNGSTARIAEVEVYAKGGSVGTGAPIGKTIWLKANANNRYVSAWNDVNRTLQARVDGIGTWERFTVEDAGSGYIALKATINNQYVSAWNDADRTLQARVGAIGEWEKFTWGETP
ncbi:discoidin domain-containing protein [Candidatus Gracilibacteria bacterium]|nr:discoidin domain-containing protein [Candidatus Gracilibacteria bacterium]